MSRAVLAITFGALGTIVLATDLIGGQAPPRRSAPSYSYTIVHTYPHDPDAFTQGLEYHEGFLYEGTGLHGRSSIRKVELQTGAVLQRRPLSPAFFGEGITLWGSHLIQLTWQSQIAFVYDRETFTPQGTFTYTGEGWGLTHDGTNLIMSDGTADLRFLDPQTYRERRRVRVMDAGAAVTSLNELEYVRGEIFANVWQTDLIARISPDTGRVVGWIDCEGLLGATPVSPGALLNGIAYDEANDRLFVTGKLWPRLFEVHVGRAR